MARGTSLAVSRTLAVPMTERRTVFSSEHGRICVYCKSPVSSCKCNKGKAIAKQQVLGDGRVRVRREKKGRGGKTATVIVGLPLAEAELKALGKKLKARCGTGGSVKDGEIVIQGDHRDTLVEVLRAEGYDAKPSGG